MDLRQLKTLIAIAEHGSFAAAGDAIGLTQSAVSLHVKALEDHLDTKLFDRTTRPPRLNIRGRNLVDRAREIVEQCEGLSDVVTGEALSGSLDLGSVPTLLSAVLPPALSAIRVQNPDLRIRVTSGLSADLVGQVHKGDLDAAVVTEPSQLQMGLSWHMFAEEPLMVIAPKGTKGSTDRELLDAGPFIRFQRFAWAGRLIDTFERPRYPCTHRDGDRPRWKRSLPWSSMGWVFQSCRTGQGLHCRTRSKKSLSETHHCAASLASWSDATIQKPTSFRRLSEF